MRSVQLPVDNVQRVPYAFVERLGNYDRSYNDSCYSHNNFAQSYGSKELSYAGELIPTENKQNLYCSLAII